MIAYKLLQWLGKRHVRQQHVRVADPPLPWRELHELVFALWIPVGSRLFTHLAQTSPP